MNPTYQKITDTMYAAHAAHCDSGDYLRACKFGDDNCPILHPGRGKLNWQIPSRTEAIQDALTFVGTTPTGEANTSYAERSFVALMHLITLQVSAMSPAETPVEPKGLDLWCYDTVVSYVAKYTTPKYLNVDEAYRWAAGYVYALQNPPDKNLVETLKSLK